MGWPFCPKCRFTLDVFSDGRVECSNCPFSSNLLSMFDDGNLPISITTSADTVVPTWAKSDVEQRAAKQSGQKVRATVEEPCVKCGHPEVGYYTVQLRSVDEGQTVFYECPACNHTWSINN